MGNALRLFVFCLALATVGATAALSQLWVRQRAQSRQPVIPPDLKAYYADQQKAVAVNVTVAFASLLLVALAAGIRRRTPEAAESVARSRGDMQQVEHFARTAAAREEALRHEREERRRADENLSLQQLLLNQALGEKLKLGRDLHDGVIQSLYATGLTLESSRQKRATDAPAADTLFERGLQMLNDNIREIRGYINSLSQTRTADHRGFSGAIETLIATLKGNRDTEFVVRIDEGAEARLDPAQMPDVLQILREAVSNALRHGAASRVTLRLHEDGARLALFIQDNGTGFDPASLKSSGHGLANFRARAALLHADLRIDSQPGTGTRIVLTLPVLSSST